MDQTPTRPLTLARALALTPLLCTLASAAQDAGARPPAASPPKRASDGAVQSAARPDTELAAFRLAAQVDGLDAVLPQLRARLEALIAESRSPSASKGSELEDSIAAYLTTELELLHSAGRIAEAKSRAGEFLQLNTADAPTMRGARARALKAPVMQSLAEIHVTVATPNVGASIRTQEAEDAQREAVRIVRDAIERNDHRLLERLGTSIIDVYADLAREATHPTQLLKDYRGPLSLLGRYAPERAIEVGLELVARPGQGWCAAVASELSLESPSRSVFDNPAVRGSEELTALYSKLLECDELTPELALRIVVSLTRAETQGPLLERAIERAMPSLRSAETFRQNVELLPIARGWMGSSDPTKRRMGIQAVAGRDALTREDIAHLTADADPEVRILAARALETTPKDVDMTAEGSALWWALLNDPVRGVREAAYRSVAIRLEANGRSPLTSAQIAALVQRVATSPEEADIAGSLVSSLSRIVAWVDQSDATDSERASTYQVLLRAPWPSLRNEARRATRRTGLAIAVLRGYEAQPGDDAELTSHLSSLAELIGRASTEERLAGYVTLIQGDPQQRGWAQDIVATSNSRNNLELGLTATESGLAVGALRAMVTADPDRVASALYGTDWTVHSAPLAIAAGRADLTPRERIALNAALAAASPADEAPRVALKAALEGLAQDGAESISLPLAWAASALSKDPSASLALLGELLASPRLSDEAFAAYSAPKPPADGYPRALALPVVDALERRVIAAGEGAAPRFSYMQYNLLKAIVADPTLYRPKLARNWLLERTQHEDLARAAHLAGDQVVVDIVRERLAANVANFSGTSEWQIKAVLDSLLAVPGEATAEDLAEIAVSTQSQMMRKEIVERLETIASARELGARLRRASTPEADRGRAVAETLALLADTNEAVRVQAIRGLATLGAVEHLPRLVKLVGSGSAAEKKAALEALDLLHRRAARDGE